jgi:hypothetical protein
MPVMHVEIEPEHEVEGKASSVSKNLVFLCGVLGLTAAAWLAFGPGIESLAQTIAFCLISAISLSAVATAFPGTARFSFGRLFTASGILAVLSFIIVLLLQVTHLVHVIDLNQGTSDRVESSSTGTQPNRDIGSSITRQDELLSGERGLTGSSLATRTKPKARRAPVAP